MLLVTKITEENYYLEPFIKYWKETMGYNVPFSVSSVKNTPLNGEESFVYLIELRSNPLNYFRISTNLSYLVMGDLEETWKAVCDEGTVGTLKYLTLRQFSLPTILGKSM